MTGANYGPTIVELRTDESGHSCGYCHTSNTSFSNGMWAHTMTVEDYQELVDRGWRRSGHTCYKPIMTTTCCPMYTIKCAAEEFKVSKSQKKIIKRVNNFLAYGVVDKNIKSSFHQTEIVHSLDVQEPDIDIKLKKPSELLTSSNKLEMGDTKLIDEPVSQQLKQNETVYKKETSEAAEKKEANEAVEKKEANEAVEKKEANEAAEKKEANEAAEKKEANEAAEKKEANEAAYKKEANETVDKSETNETDNIKSDELKKGKSKQKKAKYLRLERKKQKLRERGLSEKEIEEKILEKKKSNIVKTLEDFLNPPQPEKPAHKLEIRLVRSFPAASGLEETFEIFKRYQIHVHNDPPEKITLRRFQRFLVVSPLEIRLVLVKSPEFEKTFMESVSLFAKYQKAVHEESDGDCNAFVFNCFLVDSPLEPINCYGSYHQQYWLDGKLIAVGVIDVLPKCLSSVYFLYDPDYMWLSLGTYGALRELEFVRKLTSQNPEIKYYYMGYYIHSCVKMRYKAAFKPSYLLCPEAYTWHPIHTCLPKLDISKYSRLNEDPTIIDGNSMVLPCDISILYRKTVMSLIAYAKQKKCNTREREEILKYASLVGLVCAKKILLYRP